MFRKLFIIIFIIFILGWIGSSMAAVTEDLYPFKSSQQSHRFHHLCKQFRCLVCQNESLADSNAPLAKDLRFQIYKMVKSNHSDEEIIKFLVSRYGDFVLFRPPVTAFTFFLWFGPLLMLLAALARLAWLIYHRKKQEDNESKNYRFSKQDREKIRHLLRDY